MIELIIAILISTVVIGAAWKLLTANQRFYRSQSQIQDVEQNLRAAATVVPGDLRELDAKGGDLVSMYDTMINIHAMRGFGVVCKVDQAAGKIYLRSSLLFLPVSIDSSKHNVLVFREADSTKNSDDTWQSGSISSINTASTCADLSTATRLSVTLANGNTKLDSVAIGAPVRLWENVIYRLWNDGTGTYWLGASSFQNGAWTTTQPIAGPVSSSPKGIQFAYYDSTGAVTATASSVARITMTVRAISQQNIIVAGRPTGPYKDSITVSATLRNN